MSNWTNITHFSNMENYVWKWRTCSVQFLKKLGIRLLFTCCYRQLLHAISVYWLEFFFKIRVKVWALLFGIVEYVSFLLLFLDMLRKLLRYNKKICHQVSCWHKEIYVGSPTKNIQTFNRPNIRIWNIFSRYDEAFLDLCCF